MDRIILCLVLSVLFAIANATTFTDCGSTSGEVKSVDVTNCPDSEEVCKLERGKSAGITINFVSKCESKSLKAVVHGVIHSVPMPFPIPNPDACKSGVTCPMKNGETYTYTNNLNIRNSYPAISVTVRWELQDDQTKNTVCVEIPAVIK